MYARLNISTEGNAPSIEKYLCVLVTVHRHYPVSPTDYYGLYRWGWKKMVKTGNALTDTGQMNPSENDRRRVHVTRETGTKTGAVIVVMHGAVVKARQCSEYKQFFNYFQMFLKFHLCPPFLYVIGNTPITRYSLRQYFR